MAKGIDKRSKYTPETDDLVKGFALLGYTNKEIAKELEVTERTFYNWLKIYPSLFQSLKEARIPPDIEVAGALFKRATGYDYTEERAVTINNELHIVQLRKHMAPSVAAIMIWLRNRQGEHWRDVQEPIPAKEQADDTRFLDAIGKAAKDAWKDE